MSTKETFGDMSWRDVDAEDTCPICRDDWHSRELAEIAFVRPYCRIGDVVKAGIARRQSASVYLKALVEIGILEERKFGREKLFINPAFLALLADREPARR